MNDISVLFERLSPYSKTPIFTHCRKLISEGKSPSDRLLVYRTPEQPAVIVNHIGDAAKLTVREDPSLRFARFRGHRTTNLKAKYRAQKPISLGGVPALH